MKKQNNTAAQVSAAANDAAEPKVQATQDVQQEEQAAPAQANEVQPEQANIDAAKEQPKRKGQTYAERKERKRLIAEGLIEPRQRIAKEQAPAGPRPKYLFDMLLKVDKSDKEGAAPEGLRNVIAIHKHEARRHDSEDVVTTFAYELEGMEDAISEALLEQQVSGVYAQVK